MCWIFRDNRETIQLGTIPVNDATHVLEERDCFAVTVSVVRKAAVVWMYKYSAKWTFCEMN